MSVFETRFQVRFGHVDPAGIVYYPRIFDYLHEVFEEVWEGHVGVRYDHLVMEERLGFPLVHSEVDFRHPMRFGDRPRVAVSCTRLGRSSLALRYRIRLAEELCVEAKMTTACVQLDEMRAVEIPQRFRARFEEIQESS